MTDRSIDLSIEVPGDPDEVWDTIASGPGISSWFVPTTLQPSLGGEVQMEFGDYGPSTARVTAWEPPHRLRYEADEGGLAYEWLVEARDGGSCVVRLVNSGFGDGASWDGEFEGMSEGWRIFLAHLRLQLTHFRGRRARAVIPTGMAAGPNAAAWRALCEAFGVDPDLGAGDDVSTSADGPAFGGRVETRITTAKATAYLLLLDHPWPGTGFLAAEGDGDQVAVSAYLYAYPTAGDATDDLADDLADDVSTWLAAVRQRIAERFASVAVPPGS